MVFRLLQFGLLAVSVTFAQNASPVIINQRVLWEIYSPHSGASAAQRAADVTSSILLIAGDSRRDLQQFRDMHLPTESILLLGNVYVFSVTEEDARLAGKSRNELFTHHKQQVLSAIQELRKDLQWSRIIKSSALAFGAWIVALGALLLIHNIYGRLLRWVKVAVAWKSRRKELAAWYDIFEGPLNVLLNLSLRLIFAGLGLSVFFTALSYSLGQFPTTSGVAGEIISTGTSVSRQFVISIVNYIPNLFVVIFVLLATYAAIRISHRISDAVDRGQLHFGGFHPEWARPTHDLLRVLLILFGLVVAFPYLPGGESQALKGASIFIGVLVSLGSGSAMGNVVSGVILTYMRPFRVGDYVQIGDTVGDVVEKSLLVTRIRTIKNVETILPNSSVLGAHILNFSAHTKNPGLILHSTITIGYDVPWQSIHQALIRAALRTPRILPQPAPFVLQTSLNDYHISYQVNAYTLEANRMMETYSELHKFIHEEFNAAGIEIMSPGYLSIRDGNTTTLPQAHRPDGYQPQAFRLRDVQPPSDTVEP